MEDEKGGREAEEQEEFAHKALREIEERAREEAERIAKLLQERMLQAL
jgi:hypothetical protein